LDSRIRFECLVGNDESWKTPKGKEVGENLNKKMAEIDLADEPRAAPKQDKRPHFTAAEELVLVEECIKHWPILDGKLTPSLTYYEIKEGRLPTDCIFAKLVRPRLNFMFRAQ